MKYAMLQCWGDGNRGDLGIMIATVTEIKKQDPDAVIYAVSCYNAEDPSFNATHEILKKYVDKVYPAIYGVMGVRFAGRYLKNRLGKAVAFVIDEIRYRLLMIFPCSYSYLFLHRGERETLEMMKHCDVLYQKGGSAYTDYGSKRGYYGLRRLCRFFLLLQKYELDYFILGQSFGPVDTTAGIKIVNRVIQGAKKVYIREEECVERFPELSLRRDNVRFSNDAGFLIYPEEPENKAGHKIKNGSPNIGLTIRNMETTSNYKEIITDFIKYLAEEYNACVHIFRQVDMDNEIDNVMAQRVVDSLDNKYRKSVEHHTEKMTPQNLCWWYGKMDAFIGTRLHSTIFAMTAGVPTIGLVYQGTKTQGIFKNIGVEEWVIDGVLNLESLQKKFDRLWLSREAVKKQVDDGVKLAQYQMKKTIEEMIEIGKVGDRTCV